MKDNHRIVQFTAPSSSLDLHGSRHLEIPNLDRRPDDVLLKNHFYFCLQTRIIKASPGNYISEAEVEKFRERLLGLGDLSDPEWGSRIGKEIMRVEMLQSLYSPEQP
jgi:hypothetical protein